MEIFQYSFTHNAIIAAILGSIACGIVGTFVIHKRLVSMSGSIAHSAFGAIGISYYFGINPSFLIFPFCIAAALIMDWIRRVAKMSTETGTTILWSFSMAIGVLFFSLKSGYAPDLIGYLFGNILLVSQHDLWVMFSLDLAMVAIVTLLFKELVSFCFDEEHTTLTGLPTAILSFIVLTLVVLTIIILIRIVGIILVLALLTIPTSIASFYSRSFLKILFLSVAISIFLTLSGLIISFILNLPSGAVIILFSGITFLICYILKGARLHKAGA